MRLKLNKKSFSGKKLAVFDLDGTLTPSKSPIGVQTAKLLAKLIQKMPVVIIGGGKYEQFQKQLLNKIKVPRKYIKNMFLFPVNSTSFYRFEKSGWKKIYSHNLTVGEKQKILGAFKSALKNISFKKALKTYGNIIEDRDSQITFSALGQKAPLLAKDKWNKKGDIRPELMKILKKYLPGFEIRQGGLTSIDVTKKGIDKAYGVRQIAKTLKVPVKKMLFIGDALRPNGNDYSALKTGVDYIKVSGPDETNKLIRKLLENRDCSAGNFQLNCPVIIRPEHPSANRGQPV